LNIRPGGGLVRRHQVRFPTGRSRLPGVSVCIEAAPRRLDGHMAEQKLDLIQFAAMNGMGDEPRDSR
jgi:hypothetical protein